MPFGDASVVAVAVNREHALSKHLVDEIALVAGMGVEGDAHAGATVQHRSRVAKDPTMPNLRQVHLIHSELFDELSSAGFSVAPGVLGENITTSGLPLLELPVGTVLVLGEAVIAVTGLRNPCVQLDRFQKGLFAALAPRDDEGRVHRKAGVMGVVLGGGTVRPGDPIAVSVPPLPHSPLDPV